MTLRTILLASAAALTASSAFAWGQKGHDVVAFIAENHLTPTTKAAVENLLGGKSIVYWSNWLDNASHTDKYAYTKTWHYRNINADQTYDNAPRNRTGDVITAINQQVYTLSNPAAPLHEQQLALKILVHCMGDLHQPMHMGHYSDLGGNKWIVKYFRGAAAQNHYSAGGGRVDAAPIERVVFSVGKSVVGLVGKIAVNEVVD